MDKSIDAVLVCTPDHTHAVAAITAMKMRKHVFCDKPLAHSIYEVRAMMAAAGKYIGRDGSCQPESPGAMI